MSFRMKKIILNSFGAVCLISWILFIYFYYFHFKNVAPIIANPATGQIYKVNNHGYVFFLTEKQTIIAFIPCFIAIASFVTCALLELRWKIYGKIYGKPPRPSL